MTSSSVSAKPFQRGVIEGFYGEPWSWATREAYAPFLKSHGFDFYTYAPKGDPYFRKRWRDPFPSEHRDRLAALVDHYHRHGVRFGVGFSPYEIFRSFDSETRALLENRIRLLDDLGIDTLALLFDDMRGDLPDLAPTQVEILHWVRERTRAKELLFCPTYYTFDPILDKVFGQRPEGYLEYLGRHLDRSIDMYWTGEKVCSTSYTPEHLDQVAALIDRKPYLWDNYPVNDGASMCKFLKLRPMTGRPASLAQKLSGHAVNPMNEAFLSQIPLITLDQSYRKGTDFDPDAAFVEACRTVGGPQLERLLARDLARFQDEGLTKFSDEEKAAWKAEYLTLRSEAGNEVVRWLDGHYEVTRELVLTQ